MSTLNNKQIVHIAAECAVLAAITFYFSIKYKQIQARLTALNNRIEEQSELIQKNDAYIKNIIANLNLINSKFQRETPDSSSKTIPSNSTKNSNIKKQDDHENKETIIEEPLVQETNSDKKNELPLPTRKAPIIEEISMEEELKNELEELETIKTPEKDEKKV